MDDINNDPLTVEILWGIQTTIETAGTVEGNWALTTPMICLHLIVMTSSVSCYAYNNHTIVPTTTIFDTCDHNNHAQCVGQTFNLMCMKML
jgi:hypothetical protein